MKKFLIIPLLASFISASTLEQKVLGKLVLESMNTKESVSKMSKDLEETRKMMLKLKNELSQLRSANPSTLVELKDIKHPNNDKPSIVSLSNEYYVTAVVLIVRESPNINSKKVGHYYGGGIIKAIDVNGEWAQTEKGYCFLGYLKPMSSVTIKNKEVGVSRAKLRSAPRFDDNVLGTVKKGTVLTVYSELINDTWYRVKDDKSFVHYSIVEEKI